jgi:aminoglycoside phosphotransferase (APT) family kinase protein
MKATLETIRNIGLGMSPRIRGDMRFGLNSVTPQELTPAMAMGVPDARIEHLKMTSESKGTTDRARLELAWNEAGRAAGLPETAFAKGTPSTTSSRVLNSAFGLCESEVRFYNEVQPTVAKLTLTPYLARVGEGGRFAIVLEDLGGVATFFQPADEPGLAHAEAMMDVLAELHARYWRSSRFETDLSWITPYSRRPGYPLAHKVVVLAEKKWNRMRDDIPPTVRRLTSLYVKNRPALDLVWESLPPTLCHGDSHLGNTYAKTDGTSGIYDWQNVHKMNGMRDVAYFIGHALSTEVRRAEEKGLIERYLDCLAARDVKDDLPSLHDAFKIYRLLMIDAWVSVWVSVAIGGMVEQRRGEVLIRRFYETLTDLDTEQALRDAL